MSSSAARSQLTPWYIGLVVILAAIAYAGYELVATGCATSTPISVAVLLVVPAVYLGLMYLTLKSQA